MTHNHAALQNFFNQGYLGLQSQGFKRSTRNPDLAGTAFCLYRGPEGRKCFVGWNIADDSYTAVMDEGVYSHGEFQAQGMFRDIENKHFGELQQIHDGAKCPADMKGKLRDFAKRHLLIVPQADLDALTDFF